MGPTPSSFKWLIMSKVISIILKSFKFCNKTFLTAIIQKKWFEVQILFSYHKWSLIMIQYLIFSGRKLHYTKKGLILWPSEKRHLLRILLLNGSYNQDKRSLIKSKGKKTMRFIFSYSRRANFANFKNFSKIYMIFSEVKISKKNLSSV